MAIAKVLKFSEYIKQSNPRLKERIINDINAKKAHEAELNKEK